MMFFFQMKCIKCVNNDCFKTLVFSFAPRAGKSTKPGGPGSSTGFHAHHGLVDLGACDELGEKRARVFHGVALAQAQGGRAVAHAEEEQIHRSAPTPTTTSTLGFGSGPWSSA